LPLAQLAGNAPDAFEATGGAGQWELGDIPDDA